MAELNKLKKLRSTEKAKFTRFANFFNENKLDQSKVLEIRNRYNKAETIYDIFNDIQTQIEDIDESETTVNDRIQFEDIYYATMAEISSHINKQVDSCIVSQNIVPDKHQVQIRLPTIELPKFNGSYEDWTFFSDNFTCMIHDKENISDIHKLQYLRSSLQGSALEFISSLQITGNNYHVAWQLLQKRYNNKRNIVHNHIKQLFELINMTKDSAHQLRSLIDNVNRHLASLNAIAIDTKSWDLLIIHLLLSKLDINSRREWESVISRQPTINLPTLKDFIIYLNQRCTFLEATSRPENIKQHFHPIQRKHPLKQAYVTNNYPTCTFCKQNHNIYRCDKFLQADIQQRINIINKAGLCINCLRGGHAVSQCTSGNCRKCNKTHNTLLHLDETPSTSTSLHTLKNMDNDVLLPTAMVLVRDSLGNDQQLRVLMDSGSQSNFMTEEAMKRLGLTCKKINMPLAGINGIMSHSSRLVQTTIRSTVNQYSRNLNFIILPTITAHLPTFFIPSNNIKFPTNIRLADPTFHINSPIDMLIGAELFYDTLCVGQIRITRNGPIIQKTQFGWIVAGCVPYQQERSQAISCNLSTRSLEDSIERFWRLEEIPRTKIHTDEEILCEGHYKQNTIRNPDGRFVVRLLKKPNAPVPGQSLDQAMNRFHAFERKLHRNPDLKSGYSSFMDDYEQLQHMSKINITDTTCNDVQYLPHHCVLKQSSTTTKTRVVFDASAPTTNGTALNDMLMTGPTIQDDLHAIALRFRTHLYVITADIEKMYRQILIHPQDRDLQRIVWRKDASDQLSHYQLNTVTYGQTCAPYLAIRSLQQLAHDNMEMHPITSNIILKDFYVDDVLTGSNDMQELCTIKEELTSILASAGFPLRKWRSNVNVMNEDIDCPPTPLSTPLKTLGIYWDPVKDSLHYSVHLQSRHKATKRHILSVISQIYDPLGLIGPIVIKAKLIIQKLWQLGIDWDASLPMDLATSWVNIHESLIHANTIHIPRHVGTDRKIQLHGFCDASEEAYGACVYWRSEQIDTDCRAVLISAKSRVAPLKAITLPRLELCGALLLSQLMKKIVESLNQTITNIYYWCDSTICLSWIKTPPTQLKTFVSNRVAEIQDLTTVQNWRHIPTHYNPADIISRGLNARELSTSKLWWNGPEFLKTSESTWPKNIVNTSQEDIPELKIPTNSLIVTRTLDINIFTRYSLLTKLQRVLAYCHRFSHNCKFPATRRTGPLRLSEVTHNSALKLMQYDTFSNEINDLLQARRVKPSSRLITLHQYLDECGLLRVGGRISKANIDHDHKHPIILDSKHRLTHLIVTHEHERLLHAGPSLLLSTVRLKYWPLAGRNLVKKICRSCILCFRSNSKPPIVQNIMADLPSSRVNPTRPFSICGVDYAGPFNIREGSGRGRKRVVKSYICIFICFVTKAIHIELATDLSTSAFMNALKRFVSRRGKGTRIHSDNGTNFVGTNNELQRLLTSDEYNTTLFQYCANESIEWSFIPPRAPTFGGLWEAAVKSAKTFIKKIIGCELFTYEEFYTIIVQIEACLNSRPLTPLSTDPSDLLPLTPGHFLIGSNLQSIPQPDLRNTQFNRLPKYQRCQQLVQQFWTRWTREYLSQLQQRYKWTQEATTCPEIGNLVVLKEENTPPQRWHLGRILKLHHGDDNVCRVVTVKTNSGTFVRAVSKLAVLPIYFEKEQ